MIYYVASTSLTLIRDFTRWVFETIMFHTSEKLQTSLPEDVIVGYVDTVRNHPAFGIVTLEIDYPEELQQYLGRRIGTQRSIPLILTQNYGQFSSNQ